MEILINSNTSLDCLHSKDAVLHAHLNLPESMLRCQLPRWYGKTIPNLVLTFPKLDSLQCPQLSVTLDHQGLKVSILRWNHNLASAFVGSKNCERVLTNPNHLVRELQAWLNLNLNTYENCERVLTNPNHLVRGLQTWLNLRLNTYENCEWVLTNLNHLVRKLQAWLNLSLNTYENCKQVLTNPNHLVRGLQAWLNLSLNTSENCEWVLTNPNHLVWGLQAWLNLSLKLMRTK